MISSKKQSFKKIDFTIEQYKVFFELLDKLYAVETGSQEYTQSKDALMNHINNYLFLARDEQALPGMHKITNQAEHSSTKEAELASQIILESVMAALTNQVSVEEQIPH